MFTGLSELPVAGFDSVHAARRLTAWRNSLLRQRRSPAPASTLSSHSPRRDVNARSILESYVALPGGTPGAWRRRRKKEEEDAGREKRLAKIFTAAAPLSDHALN